MNAADRLPQEFNVAAHFVDGNVDAGRGGRTAPRGLGSTATTCPGFCAGIRRLRSPRTPE